MSNLIKPCDDFVTTVRFIDKLHLKHQVLIIFCKCTNVRLVERFFENMAIDHTYVYVNALTIWYCNIMAPVVHYFKLVSNFELYQ